ncbi:Major facilitator superfamily domain general substrate transporter [Penicillium chrysogenum]|nr:Major facilitator superfamily domain general substrate transporter [Penicillium chrysogenum]
MADTLGKKCPTKQTPYLAHNVAINICIATVANRICTCCETETKQCIYPPSRRRGHPKGKQPTYIVEAPVPRSSIDSSLDSHFPTSNPSSSSSIVATGETEASFNSNSQYLGLYYKSFHATHPCVLPLHALKQRLTDPAIQPLLRVLCYVGSIFDSSGHLRYGISVLKRQ